MLPVKTNTFVSTLLRREQHTFTIHGNLKLTLCIKKSLLHGHAVHCADFASVKQPQLNGEL